MKIGAAGRRTSLLAVTRSVSAPPAALCLGNASTACFRLDRSIVLHESDSAPCLVRALTRQAPPALAQHLSGDRDGDPHHSEGKRSGPYRSSNTP